ncbi:MAG: SDR family oxidoreductase [Alphaproteobacteria bacterium]|nr:SDR family oxidoreductase [Alphaproteobacteria bacterium]
MKIEAARALVTGGAQGMGRCFVERFKEAGARVAFCDVNADGVKATAAELGVPGFVCDVSDEESVSALVRDASEALGGINVLVNNAGITRDGLLLKQDRTTGEMQGFSLAKWNQVLAVNLTGPFLCTRAFAMQCVERGIEDACIVNMSSISKAGNMGQGNYSATKAGIASDTVVWAKELAKFGIRVGAIAPGFIRTPMVEAMRDDVLQKVIAPVPLKRLGEPDEIWEAVRFIVGCGYFTGRTVEVDGGLRL